MKFKIVNRWMLCDSFNLLRGVCLAILVSLAGCKEKSASSTTTPKEQSAVAEPSIAAQSIINADDAKVIGDFSFVDQDGSPFSRQDLAGRLVIVNFVFTACPGTCPQQSAAMQSIQQRLDELNATGISLVTISVDPQNDTPQVLKDYGALYNADFKKWKFLTGEQQDIWSFSKVELGMSVAENPDDPLIPIAHESKFVLVDRSGRIRGYFDAITESGMDELWKAIDLVLPEFAPPGTLLAAHGLPEGINHIAQPPGILDSDWLARVAERESAELREKEFVPGFLFEEASVEAGVNFKPQIVDDQRHRLLVNHYDHGNSVSVADVDNDGILDLYFTSQVGPNALYRGTKAGTFEDVTEESGVGLADRISVAASFCDTDNDGDVDLFVSSIRSGNVFFENDGTGKFSDKTTQANLDYVGHSSKGTFFDYDKDGLVDLFVSNVGKFTTQESALVRHDLCNSQPDTELKYFVGRPDAFAGHLVTELNEPSLLFRNLGGNRFENVTAPMGLSDNTMWSGDAIAFDANSDSWPDLYVCNMQGHDCLYINQNGKKFVAATNDYFSATPWGTMGVSVADFDNNGLFDIFLTDMHSDMSVDIGPDNEKQKSEVTWPEEFLKSEGRSVYGNAFFRQTESAKFEEVSDQINAENYWPWGLSNGDLNADGFQDAFLTSSMCFPYRYCTNSLLLNDRGKRFLDAQFATGIEPRADSELIAPWFSVDFQGEDADNDLRQGRDGTWVVWSATGSRSSAILDYDNDGDLDIITNEFNTRPQVFRSNLHLKSPNQLKIKLTGTHSNRNALGSIVTVEAGDLRQQQLHNGSSGYLSQSIMPLYFGLGANSKVDRIQVIWPSGKTQVIDGPIESQQLLEITEE